MRSERQPCIYILASGHYGTLYIGVTPGFTSQYAIHRLVRFELFADMERAIAREKQLKRWHRQWKINLIETENPHWGDLAIDLGLPPLTQRQPPDGP